MKSFRVVIRGTGHARRVRFISLHSLERGPARVDATGRGPTARGTASSNPRGVASPTRVASGRSIPPLHPPAQPGDPTRHGSGADPPVKPGMTRESRFRIIFRYPSSTPRTAEKRRQESKIPSRVLNATRDLEKNPPMNIFCSDRRGWKSRALGRSQPGFFPISRAWRTIRSGPAPNASALHHRDDGRPRAHGCPPHARGRGKCGRQLACRVPEGDATGPPPPFRRRGRAGRTAVSRPRSPECPT